MLVHWKILCAGNEVEICHVFIFSRLGKRQVDVDDVLELAKHNRNV